MSAQSVDPRDLRVSDDERSHVLGLLEKATGRGLIDLGEFNERSAAVIAARTRGQLNAVLLDLPGLEIGGRSVYSAEQGAAPGLPSPGFSGVAGHWAGPVPAVLELTGWGSRAFRGHWVAPAMIVIGGFGASTTLDFSQAQLSSRTVTVEFRGNFGGSTDLILPRGGSVTMDALQLRGGSLRNKVPPGGRGVLDLHLVGVKRAGAVSVRLPRPRLFG